MPNQTCRTAHYSGSKQVREQQKLAASFIISYIVKGCSSDKAANEELWPEDFVCVGLINIVSVYKVTLYSAFLKAECWKCIQ